MEKSTLLTMLDEYVLVSEFKGVIAKDVYDAQDAKTRTMIDKVQAVLRAKATGIVKFKIGRKEHPLVVSAEAVNANLLWLAVEIVKDLAFVGLRAGGFKYDTAHCFNCGSEL